MSEASFDQIKAIQPSPALFSTALTRQFKITHPVLLAGMNAAAGSEVGPGGVWCTGMVC